ncbi:MAG: hypothetical protein Ct9H300mP12_13030 [Acidimicrobiales bacterium]|nr:MAG: hypothetical protein Ct9H300mP12_13030 [Acidimicrobiales bacterium]
MAMVRELGEDTGPFRSTYDGEADEPFICRHSSELLLNGSTGIAVGMATNMPTHNLAEVHAAVTLVMTKRRPKPTIDELLAVLPGAPGFPAVGSWWTTEFAMPTRPARLKPDPCPGRHRGHRSGPPSHRGQRTAVLVGPERVIGN